MDLDDCTLGDLEFLEEYTGLPFERLKSALADPAYPKARIMTALAFISGRAADPSFTLEMARQVKPGAE